MDESFSLYYFIRKDCVDYMCINNLSRIGALGILMGWWKTHHLREE
jgi:hypothetical protein